MPSAATLAVSIRFTASPSFGVDLVLGDAASPLGTGVLSDEATLPVDITSLVNAVSINRGRDRILDRHDAGRSTVTFTDTTGAFDPDNGDHEILPMRQLKVTATYSGVLYTLYSGFIDEWDYTYTPGENAAFVTLVATDAFRILNLTTVTAVAGASAGDLTGKRLGEILDEISWPASSRDFSAGLTTCQADPGTARDTLSACQNVTDTELGAFFAKTNGVLKFMDRNAIVKAHGSSPTVFVDTGAGIYYESIDFDIDDTILANDVTVQRTGGTAQNVSDATSISSFFLRDLSRTGLLMDTDADALQQAKAILNERKDPELRIGSITIDAYGDTSNRVIAALDTELFDPIKVTRTQPGGGTVTRTLSVQGIEHTITPSSWKTTFQTAEAILGGFILDSSTSGVLGTSALSY
tara:strand:- start:2955 stop:4184 length:1230 start_codon:yes stop_codon:yes gene_type:complete